MIENGKNEPTQRAIGPSTCRGCRSSNGCNASAVRPHAVVRIGGRILRHGHAKVDADLHAFNDEIDAEAVGPFHLPQAGPHVVFLAYAFFRPLDGNVVIAGEALDPLAVLGGALAQDVLGDGADAMHIAEEVHDVLRRA